MGNTLQANQAYTQHGDSNSHEEVIADISPECLTELTSLKISKEKANLIEMMIHGCGVRAWKEEENVRRERKKTRDCTCKGTVCVYHPCTYHLLVGIVYMYCEIIDR